MGFTVWIYKETIPSSGFGNIFIVPAVNGWERPGLHGQWVLGGA